MVQGLRAVLRALVRPLEGRMLSEELVSKVRDVAVRCILLPRIPAHDLSALVQPAFDVLRALFLDFPGALPLLEIVVAGACHGPGLTMPLNSGIQQPHSPKRSSSSRAAASAMFLNTTLGGRASGGKASCHGTGHCLRSCRLWAVGHR